MAICWVILEFELIRKSYLQNEYSGKILVNGLRKEL